MRDKRDDRHDTVRAEVAMSFLVSRDLAFRIPVGLAYDATDPYAVEITFHLPGDAPVSWAFARELLLDGLSAPTGEGDVHIAPVSPEAALGDVHVRLQVGGERALFRVAAAPLVAFLDLTDRLVPFGQERLVGDPAADLDAVLDQILCRDMDMDRDGLDLDRDPEDRYAG